MASGQEVVLSRRSFMKSAGAAALFTGRRSIAQDQGIVPTMLREAARANITVHTLRRNISVLEGSGGNIAVLTGKDGKVLVDAGFSASRSKISGSLASLSDVPITHLINTHWHIDHTDGNEWLHSSGALIVAHENTKKHLSVPTRIDAWDYTFPPTPADGIPRITFTQHHSLYLNDTLVDLRKYPSAHTDSDISVRFVEADVLHAGDTFWNGDYPFIDYSTGGSIDGSILAAEENIAKTTEQTIVIPGHGPVGNRAALIEFRDMLATIRERVAKLKKQGDTLSATLAAKPTATFDEKWGQFLTTPAAFTKYVYQGV